MSDSDIVTHLAQGNRRRLAAVLGFTLFDLLLLVFGVRVPACIFAIFALWLAAVGVVALLRRRVRDDRAATRLHAASLAGDIVFVTANHFYFSGGWWQGAVIYGFVVVVAQATLPRRHALALTIGAIVAFDALVTAQALGAVDATIFLGVPSLRHDPVLATIVALTGTSALYITSEFLQSFVGVIRRSEERHRLLLQNASDMIFTYDLAGRVQTMNAAAVELLGHERSEVLGHPFDEFVPAEELPAARAAFAATVTTGEVQRLQLRYVPRERSPRWVSLVATPVREAGVVTGVFVIARDVTDQRRADAERETMQRELARAERMTAVGQLVSGVAHELNNPLSAILNFSEDLLTDDRPPSDREALETILAQARRARSIVRDLLATVRTGGEERARDAVAPHALVARCASALTRRLTDMGVRFAVDVPTDLPEMEVDVLRLEQVLTNLVVNGAQATRRGGLVRLSARDRAQRVELVVEDDGTGLTSEVMAHLFEPFFTTKPVGQGTGLGLSVSRGIVEEHGGQIRAENRAAVEGGGARFVVALPPARQHADLGAGAAAPSLVKAVVETAAAPATRAAGSPAPRLLLVDDEESIRSGLRRFFQRRGWQVDEASGGGPALERLLAPGAPEYTVILCDLRMPDVSGVELHARLRAARPELLSRLIFSTGDVASAEAAAFLAETRCPVLEKPFELSVLGETIDRVRDSRVALAG